MPILLSYAIDTNEELLLVITIQLYYSQNYYKTWLVIANDARKTLVNVLWYFGAIRGTTASTNQCSLNSVFPAATRNFMLFIL